MRLLRALAPLLVLVSANAAAAQEEWEDTVVCCVEPARDSLPRVAGVAVDSVRVRTHHRAAASTITELIRGRVAGLNVLESGGSVGAAPRLWIRGPSSVLLRNDPLVVVDGIRIVSHPDALSIAVGGAGTSRLEDIDPNDVAGVQVLRGPAATALYGPEAAGGALLVTTRAATVRGPRFHAWSGVGARSDATEYPSNFTRLGPSGTCTLQLQARGSCPGGASLLSFNPLEEASPFRTGQAALAGVSMHGYALGGWYAFSGGLENAEGVLATSHREMRSLRASAGLSDSPLELVLTASHVRRETALPFGDQSQFGRIGAGLAGFPVDDEQTRGYLVIGPEDDFYHNTESVRHTTLGARATWDTPLPWLQAHLHASRDQAGADEVSALTRGVPGNTGTFRRTVAIERARSAVGAGVTTHWGDRLNLRGTLGVERLGWMLDRVQDDGSATRETLRDEQSDVGVYLQSHISWWPYGVTLSGAVRRDEPSRTRQPQWSYSVGGSWGKWLPFLRGSGSVLLRAAHGETERGVEWLAAPAGPCTGACPARPRTETLAETEGGVDLWLFRGAVTLGVTTYRRQTRHLMGFVPQESAFRSMGSLHNRGLEVQAALRGGRADGVAWEIEASGARNRNRVEADEDGFVPLSSVFGTANRHGRPLGSYFFRPILRAEDRDGDGIIEVCTGTSVCEVQLGSEEQYLGSSLPERLAAVAGTLRVGGWVTLYARADHQGGARLLNLTDNLRCANRMNCRADYDPATPVDEQARVVAAMQGSRVGFVHDADFVRLREVAVTLSAPRQWTRSFGASGVDLTISGRNLALWTDYPGLDPEVNAAGPEVTAAYDHYPQPPVRTWTARVDVRF